MCLLKGIIQYRRDTDDVGGAGDRIQSTGEGSAND